MNAKNRWLLGLQWGACLWLPYVLWDAAHDFYYLFYYPGIMHLFDEWPRFWWTPPCLLLFPGWIAAAVLLVAGSRWARPALAMMILVRAVVDCIQTHEMQLGHADATFFVPLLVPLLPLVVLRVEEPRIVLALAAVGRWREARARSGGVVALLVALAVLATRDAALAAVVHQCELPAACGVTIILTALAAVVTFVMWARRERGSAMA